MKNKVIFSFLLVSFSGLLIPPSTAFAAEKIPDSEPQCLPTYSVSGIDYNLEFEEFIKNWNDDGEWKQIRCSYEAPDDAILPAETPYSAVINAIYTDTLMKNRVDLCDRSELPSESVQLTFYYDNLSAQVYSTSHIEYYKISKGDIEAQAYNQLDAIANFADTCWDEIEKEFEVFDEPEKECPAIDYAREGERVGVVTAKNSKANALIKRHGEFTWEQIEPGFIILNGDEIKTEGGTYDLVKIRLDDKFCKEGACPYDINVSRDTHLCVVPYVEIEAMSEHIRLSNEKKSYLELLYGEIRSFFVDFTNSQRSSMNVKTGTSVAGIRGTDFVVSYDPDVNKINYYLNEGIIDITETTTGETQTLTAGQTLEISKGQMQPVSTLTSEVWDSLVEATGGEITQIPDWVKNNAGWWADDMIEDSDFAQGIQYLISEGIMIIPETSQAETSGGTDEIPSWIKNNAGWWADGAITDDDFLKGIQYLVEQGIIQV